MKVKNNLLNFKDKIIYQDTDFFAFSLDSLLLANFATIRFSDKKIMDFCTGNAPIPMFLTYRTRAHIYGMEIQDSVYSLGVESVNENDMADQIDLICDDVKNVYSIFDSDSFDLVLVNPPYFKVSKNSFINKNDVKSIARHEILIELEDILSSASYLLKSGGNFAMVHRPDRFLEILTLMKKYNLEPKKIRFVYPKDGEEANILLIEGSKNGKSGVKILPPLITYVDGKYSKEIRDMFGDDTHVAK